MAKSMTPHQTITWHNEVIHLLPEQAIYWPDRQLLAVADVHIGKSEYFQQHGIHIPKGDSLTDLDRLVNLTAKYNTETLLILGDFVHHTQALNQPLLNQIHNTLGRFNCQLLLIEGNHDHGIDTYQEAWADVIAIQPDVTINPFTFCHGDKQLGTEQPVIQGHIHPVITLKHNRHKLRLPCFHITKDRLVLPSFGTFTGGYNIKPKKDDAVYVVTDQTVIKPPTQ